MGPIGARHLELVKAVNEATTEWEHARSQVFLDGFLDCADLLGMMTGIMMIEVDLHYIDQGIDRPMCGGVFLDWSPAPCPPAAPATREGE